MPAPSLLAHTAKPSLDANAVTTDAIDTTGATLLVVILSDHAGTSPVSDSKGNTWTALTAQAAVDVGGGIGGAVRLHYVINPIVGTGHTFTGGSPASGPAIAIQAWDIVDPVFDDENGGHTGAVLVQNVVNTGPVLPPRSGALIITGYSDRLVSSGGLVVSAPFSPYLDAIHAIAGQNYAIGSAAYVQPLRDAIAAEWSLTTSFSIGMAAAIASFLTSAGAPVGLEYEDPCTITRPRLFMKVRTDDEIFKMSVTPMRESVAQGGLGIPRLVGVSPITKVASNPFSGELGVQAASLRNADTDRVLRTASATRTSFRSCPSEVYLTSKAQSDAGRVPRVLLAGIVHGNSADENLVHGFDVNDPIGAGYSVTGEDEPLIKRLIGRAHFPNCPDPNIGQPEPYVIGRRAPLDPLKGEGVVPGVTVGVINIGGTPGTPTGTDLATLVAALQTSKDAGTLDADWGYIFGHADVVSLQAYGGSVPSDFDSLAYGVGSFIGLGAGDISGYLDGAATTGGASYLAVLISSAAISEVLDASNGDPSLWIDDTQVNPAELGNSIWCPQVPGFTSHWSSLTGGDLFIDIAGTDGVTRRYTLVLVDPGSTYGTQLAAGAQFHLDCIGAEDVGDGTGDPFDEYFACYLEVLTQVGLQTYYSGPRLDPPQFLFSDGVTLVDRVHASSFTQAAIVWALTIPAGLKMSATLTTESFRDFITTANICGGCQFANDDYGRYFVKVLDRRRSEFFKQPDGSTHPTLRDRFDILPGFSVTPRPEWQVNLLYMQYGKNDVTGAFDRDDKGGSAPIQHIASRALHGDLRLTRAYPYLADDASASAVGTAFVAMFGWLPYVANYKRRGLCALQDDVLQGVPITHYNGFGPNGFVDFGVWPFSRTFYPEMYGSFEALCVDGSNGLLDAEDEPLPRVVADYPVNDAILVDADTGFVLVNGA